jgi:hypothetical protein
MKKINLVVFLLVSYISVAQDLTVIIIATKLKNATKKFKITKIMVSKVANFMSNN